MQNVTNWVLNKQWALVVGALGAVGAWILEVYVDEIPLAIVPLVTAAVTFLRVWSNDSVTNLEEQIPTAGTIAEIGDEVD